ncbi:TetR/AcrR family transcriptional regulator [Nocardioides sp. NPDC051685]|uniref:TetR/AcrR family transcriptional regulator n=1 Tax=Nocardioides sp. NPDC051685 TaxID=3364334 RepID=UPI0037AD2685
MVPREEIIDAAARLFVDQGVAGTSTREIAESVGIRQASLYYHFACKEEILLEVLQRSIRPTVDKIEKLELLGSERDATPSTLLYLLALLDVRTLAQAPHNGGALARLPEVRGMEGYDRFDLTRSELLDAYDRFAAPVAGGTDIGGLRWGALLMQLVEVVIGMRTDGDRIDDLCAAAVASSCLRVCGAGDDVIEAASCAAFDLIGAIE